MSTQGALATSIRGVWILRGSGEDKDLPTFRVTQGRIKTIGRGPRADFVIDRALVSRLHCRLEAVDGGLEVTDLSSTNGTYLNRKKVTAPVAVRTGDKIQFGRTTLELQK